MDNLLPCRGRGRFITEYEPEVDGIAIRIDDSRDDSFWLEMHLSESKLREMLASIRSEQERVQTADLAGTIHDPFTARAA